MKRIIPFAVVTLSATASLCAQGLVNFANTPTTPVYVQHTWPDKSYSIMHGTAGTYYFGLILGTPNLSSWYFTGLYATNTGVDGLFSGGVVAVPGWAAGTSTNYFVFGWVGPHDFQGQWLSSGGIRPPIFGEINPTSASGVSGNGSSIPPLNLFDGGPGTISPGFFQLQNYLVPEPSPATLGILGASIVVLRRIANKQR